MTRQLIGHPKNHGIGWLVHSYGICKEIICMLFQQDEKGGTWLQQTMEELTSQQCLYHNCLMGNLLAVLMTNGTCNLCSQWMTYNSRIWKGHDLQKVLHTMGCWTEDHPKLLQQGLKMVSCG